MNAFYFTKHTGARLMAVVALFSLVAGMVPTQAFAATIMTDTFDRGVGISNWTSDGWTSASGPSHSGNNSAKVEGPNTAQTLTRTISTVGYDTVSVSFWHRTRNLEVESDKVEALYTINGGTTWVEFGQVDGSSGAAWQQVSFSVPASADNNENFGLRFVGNLNEIDDQVFIDDVSVSGAPYIPPPASCSDGILNQDETSIDTGGVCTPAPIPCDAPYTGNQPNCVPPPCEEGYTGIFPNCAPPVVACDAPYTGNQPNCIPPPCGEGQTGVYPACVTPPPIYQCSDSVDNDQDDLTDYPNDPGCDSVTDNSETNGGGDPDPVCEDSSAQNYGDEGTCEFFVSQCIGGVEATNLLTNPSFETPNPVANGGQWEIFESIAGWTATNGIEIWNNLLNGPSHLAQNIELDTSGPTTISQPVVTIPGATYELRFDFAARSDASSEANNSILASADTNSVVAVSTDNTSWVTYGNKFVATDTSTDIAFADMGTTVGENALGYGTLLDNATLCLVSEPDGGGDEQLYTIFGYVWFDNDRDEDWDGREGEDAEEPLDGRIVRITNGEDTRETTTDVNGYYEFNVPAGTWVITEELPSRWFHTVTESHTVTVPQIPVPSEEETENITARIMNFLIPTAHAQFAPVVPTEYGEYNFGNDRHSGGGGNSAGDRDDDSDQDGEVLGDSDDREPVGAVLGDQVDAVPTGAPNTGKGGASTMLLGQFIAIPRRRNTVK